MPLTKDEREAKSNPARKLSLVYNGLMLANALIFLCVFAALFAVQFSTVRSRALSRESKILFIRTFAVNHLVSNASENVLETKSWAENYLKLSRENENPSDLLAEIKRRPNEAYYSLNGVPPKDGKHGNFYGVFDPVSASADLRREANMSLWLFEIGRRFHYAPPTFTWSFYYSRNGFATIYPWERVEGDRLMKRTGIASEVFFSADGPGAGMEARRGWGGFSRRSAWKGPHKDFSNKKMVISNTVAVQDLDRPVGAISIEVGLDLFDKAVAEVNYPNTKILVINREGQILAMTGRDTANSSEILTIKAALPADIADEISGLFDEGFGDSERPEKTGGRYIFHSRLRNADWMLVKIVREMDLAQSFIPNIIFHIGLLTAMIVLLFAAHWLMRRYFVNPAIAFVDFVRREAVEGVVPVPHSPKVWREWFFRISDMMAIKSLSANLPGAIVQLKRSVDGRISVSMVGPGIRDILGIGPEEAARRSDILPLIFPKENFGEMAAALDRSAANMTVFVKEGAAAPLGGDEKWLRFVARPRRTENGDLIWDGFILDVSDRKKAQDELKRRQGRLEEMVESRTREIEKINQNLIEEIQVRARSETALKEREEQLRILSQHAMTVQDRERARVSRDLHDEIGQQLAAILFEIAALKKRESEKAPFLGTLESMVERAGEDLHKICEGLQPVQLNQLGLGPAIKLLLWNLRDKSGIDVDLTLGPIEREVSEAAGVSIYRVCQEAVTNAIKHSGSNRVAVSLNCGEKELVLEVWDEGRGFDVEGLSGIARLGVAGMKQRATLCNGSLTIDSTPGGGTRVRLTVPAKAISRGTP